MYYINNDEMPFIGSCMQAATLDDIRDDSINHEAFSKLGRKGARVRAGCRKKHAMNGRLTDWGLG